MPKPNRHRGSRLDDVLRKEGLYDVVHAAALKRAIAEAVEEGMAEAGLSKVEMARRMRTSRSQLDRVLDPACVTVQLDTLLKAVSAVGKEIRLTVREAA